MKNKAVILFSLASWGILSMISLFRPEQTFSESENRYLTTWPEFSIETLLDRSYMDSFENAMDDQFPWRTEWAALHTISQIGLGQHEIHDVYLGTDQYLLRHYSDTVFTSELAQSNLAGLADFVSKYTKKLGDSHVRAMLVPTSSQILTNRLPAFAQPYDQSLYLNAAEKAVHSTSSSVFIDPSSILSQHSEEEIYYHTDHHWTTLGAWYAYQSWADSCGVVPLTLDDVSCETVSSSFHGTLAARIRLDLFEDQILTMTPKNIASVEILHDLTTSSDSLYDPSKLSSRDQYSLFLGGNHGISQIQVQHIEKQKNAKKSLLVIKDSFAHCMIPLLAAHFDQITVLDLRYYKSSIKELVKSEEITDLLLLYSSNGFAEDKNLSFLLR